MDYVKSKEVAYAADFRKMFDLQRLMVRNIIDSDSKNTFSPFLIIIPLEMTTNKLRNMMMPPKIGSSTL